MGGWVGELARSRRGHLSHEVRMGTLSDRGQEGNTLVMRSGRAPLSNRGQDGDTLVMR